MQYRLKDRLTEEDWERDIKRMKGELEESIQYEEKRKNVDTSKKTAMKQMMDYEGFR